MSGQRIAIIGAGMAGLVCASRLADAGATATVFEKSGDIGGRLATRRRDEGRWNHGAPRVHARDPVFRGFLERLVESGSACVDAGQGEGVAGQPDMRELLRPVAAPLTIEVSARIERLGRRAGAWQLWLAGEVSPRGPFDVVLATQPAPQIVELLTLSRLPVPPALGDVTLAPCWTLLLGFSEPADGLGAASADAVFEQAIRQSPVDAGSDRWVVHAAPAWVDAHLELDRARAAHRLMEALRGLVPGLPPPVYRAAHRWRYARVDRPLGRNHLWMPDLGLGFAGDWCPGGDAQGAFLSGRGLADAVLSGGNVSAKGRASPG